MSRRPGAKVFKRVGGVGGVGVGVWGSGRWCLVLNLIEIPMQPYSHPIVRNDVLIVFPDAGDVDKISDYVKKVKSR
jgi:hypothetical protein